MITSHRLTRSVALGAVLLVAACTDDATAPSPVAPSFSTVHANQGQPQRLEVYTQNLFLGGDTGPLFTIDFSNPFEIVAATSAFWADVQASDIPARAREIVDEIEARMPHVVALQEAFRFVELSATPVAYDFLAAIEGEMAARGLPYGQKVVIETTDAELPLAFDPSIGFTAALQITDQNAIFVRDDVPLSDGNATIYQAAIPVPGPPAPPLLVVNRAYVHVEFEFDGMTHHVVATHLETQGFDTGNPMDPAYQIRQIHNAQADELLAYTGTLAGHVIVVGDLNSDAEGSPIDPSWTPTYGKFLAAGFTDAWTVAAHSETDVGFTCCTAKDLMGPADHDERIDFVLLRSTEVSSAPDGEHRGWVNMDIVGTRSSDQTDGGLWPSDHAGLTAAMKLPLAY